MKEITIDKKLKKSETTEEFLKTHTHTHTHGKNNNNSN